MRASVTTEEGEEGGGGDTSSRVGRTLTGQSPSALLAVSGGGLDLTLNNTDRDHLWRWRLE